MIALTGSTREPGGVAPICGASGATLFAFLAFFIFGLILGGIVKQQQKGQKCLKLECE